MMKLRHADGKEVKEGDKITSFRGEVHTFVTYYKNRIRVKELPGEYYTSVYPDLIAEHEP